MEHVSRRRFIAGMAASSGLVMGVPSSGSAEVAIGTGLAGLDEMLASFAEPGLYAVWDVESYADVCLMSMLVEYTALQKGTAVAVFARSLRSTGLSALEEQVPGELLFLPDHRALYFGEIGFQSVSQMQWRIGRMPVKPELVIISGMNLISRGPMNDSVPRRLRAMSRELNLPVVAFAHPEPEDASPPREDLFPDRCWRPAGGALTETPPEISEAADFLLIARVPDSFNEPLLHLRVFRCHQWLGEVSCPWKWG